MKTLLILFTLMCLLPIQAEEMQAHLSKTRDLVKEGKYEEALERHIWFHNNALKHEPGMYGVRLSFALSNWMELGAKFPAAKEALIKIRDEKAKALVGGKVMLGFFHDVSSINRVLGEPEKTISLFEVIDKNHPQAAAKYWGVAKDAVIGAKKYELAGKYMKEPLADYEKVKARYDENREFYKDPQIGGASFIQFNENNFVRESLQLIEVCMAVKRLEEAKEILKKAMSVVDDKSLVEAIKEK